VESVKTLLSLGADPNYNNGQPRSFALAHAAEGSALVLRVMLDGGGDPNGRDAEGVPIILSNWDVSYYTDSQGHARFDLLLSAGPISIPRYRRPDGAATAIASHSTERVWG
jgi:hypothetical protein